AAGRGNHGHAERGTDPKALSSHGCSPLAEIFAAAEPRAERRTPVPTTHFTSVVPLSASIEGSRREAPERPGRVTASTPERRYRSRRVRDREARRRQRVVRRS